MLRLGLVLALALQFAACAGDPDPGTTQGGLSHFEYDQLEVRKPFFVRKGPSGDYATRNPVGRRPQRFLAKKPAGARRVFLVGGSVTQLHDVDEKARPHLVDALGALLPGKRIEVLNCGMSGYDSARSAVVFRQLLEHDPDLMIVMTGVNESDRYLLPGWAARLCGRRRLRGACARYVSWRERRMRITPESLRRGLVRNVRGMVRAARKRDVPVLLCTLPVNLRHMPPRGRLPIADADFLAGWIAFEREDWDSAAKGFESFLTAGAGPTGTSPNAASPMGHFYLARALDTLGRLEEAREHYVEAWNLHRPAPLFNEALRALAREEGAGLADLEKAFAGVSSDALPDRKLFQDGVHWDRRFDPLATAVMARALLAWARERPGGVLAPPEEWSPAWLEKNEPLIFASARDPKPDDVRSWDVFRILMWERLEREEHVFSERVLAMLETIRLTSPGLLRDEERLKSWIRDKLAGNIWNPDAGKDMRRWWPVMAAHVGELHRRSRRYARARPFFDSALRARPELREVRLRSALAHLAAGERDKADEEIARIPGCLEEARPRRWLEAYGWKDRSGSHPGGDR